MWSTESDFPGSSVGKESSCNAEDTILMAESEEELKNLLMKVKEESEKASLKFNIQKPKIMTSSPIQSQSHHIQSHGK